jgi:hypothetical protein
MGSFKGVGVAFWFLFGILNSAYFFEPQNSLQTRKMLENYVFILWQLYNLEHHDLETIHLFIR